MNIHPIRVALLNLYLFSMLSVISILAFGNAMQTTVLFEIPDERFNTVNNYAIEDVIPRTSAMPARRMGEKFPRLFDPLETEFYTFTPPADDFRVSFSGSSEVNTYFVENFVAAKEDAEAEIRTALEQTDRVTRIYAVSVTQKPLIINLAVRQNRVDLDVSGLSVRTKVKVRTSGALEKALCGSSATIEVSGPVSAQGVYHVGSGIASITNIDAQLRSDIDCNSIIGDILDPLLEIVGQRFLDNAVDDAVAPLLETFDIGGLDDLLNEDIERANQILGFDFIEYAWGGIRRYIDGLNVRFKIGVDQFGPGKHLLGFGAYQDAPGLVLRTSRTGRKINYHADFSCPSWANAIKVYDSESVHIGYQSIGGRRSKKVYGVNFNPVNVSGKSYTSDMGTLRTVTEPANGSSYTPIPKVVLATCKSDNGLYSWLRAAVFYAVE